jgi:hypothetical protein
MSNPSFNAAPAGDGAFTHTPTPKHVPSLGVAPVRSADPVLDPTHPWHTYEISRDADGDLHYDDVSADWPMQHKEPVTRREIRRAFSQGRF